MDIIEKISMMDDIYSKYLMDKDDKVFCRDLALFLTAVTGENKKNFHVTLVKSDKNLKEPFFGIRIFPAADMSDSICQWLLEDRLIPISKVIEFWKQIASWEIEIDSRIFDRMAINFNPEELTALTLHEIGYVVYSDIKPERFYRAYKGCRSQMSSTDFLSAKIVYFLYQLPLLLACGMKDWYITSRDMHEEIFADMSVERLGYSEALISAYRKIVKEYGNSLNCYNEDAEIAELQRSITWCNLNVKDLAYRRHKLKDELYYTGTRTGSPSIRETVRSIMNKLGVVTKSRYYGNVVVDSAAIAFESATKFVNEYELIYDLKVSGNILQRIEAVTESSKLEIANEAFNKKKKQIDIPTQLDVDTIFVEVDRIQNHADRRYVLDLIYNQEEKIEKFKEYFEYNPDLKSKYGAKMESMLKELASMRKAVLAKRSFNKEYKVFVKYPEGYEG